MATVRARSGAVGDFRMPSIHAGGRTMGRVHAHARNVFQAISTTSHEESHMLYFAVVFLIIAIIAAIFGFGGIAGAAVGIAKILFIVFIILFIIALIFGRRRRP
jgi:uncharacterized membrane protein YtjA (UPF0391 family)